MIGHIRFAGMNDPDSVIAQMNDRTCAVILETVQGEGGIYPAEKAFLQEIRRVCDERDILLILDEIQCGMGRTGSYFAWQALGVKPDIMTTAKALGGGVPVGAFLMTEAVGAHSLEAGDHGTTYGGNPFAGAAVSRMIDLYEENHILEHVREITVYLEQKLDELVGRHDRIRQRRGSGLMQGLACDEPVGDVIAKALERGLILINAGPSVLRFLPPLVIERKHVDEMVEILEECL